MTKNTSTPANPPPTPGHVSVKEDNGHHRHSAQALDVGAKFLLCRAPTLHPFGRAYAVGLAHGHLPSKRTRSSSRGNNPQPAVRSQRCAACQPWASVRSASAPITGANSREYSSVRWLTSR